MEAQKLTNLQIAELLRDVAASYKFKDQNKYKFQIIAYERAADSVEHATSELKDLWDDGKLDDVPGIGPSIAQHLDEIFKTGKSKHFEEVMSGIHCSGSIHISALTTHMHHLVRARTMVKGDSPISRKVTCKTNLL